MASGAEVVFNTIVPPGVSPFFERLHDAGFTRRGGHLVCTYFDENFLQHGARRACRRALQLPRLLPGRRRSVQPEAARAVRRRSIPATPRSRPAAAAPASTAAMRLWAAAVTEAGTLDQAAVIAALDHAHIAEAPAVRPRWCPASITCA